MGDRILEGKSKIFRGTKLNPPLKLGLIGCGRAAELIYAPAVNKFTHVEVTAVVDPFNERRELISKKFNNCFSNNTLDNNVIEKVDAAIICSPPDTHVGLASLLLKNNKHVLVEKPLALSLEGISNLIEINSSSRASLMMAFNHRHWEPLIDLKKHIAENRNVSSAKIIFAGNYSNWNPVSFISDPLNDLGSHLFDLIRFIFNTEIISISAKNVNEHSIKMNIAITENIFIDCLLAHSDKTIKSITVSAEAGSYYVFLGSTRIVPAPGNKRKLLDMKDRIKRKLLRKSSPIKNSYELQLKKFFSLDKHADPGIMEGVSAILAVMAARESINKNGKEISLNEIS
jgi:predicted dehydrogenase